MMLNRNGRMYALLIICELDLVSFASRHRINLVSRGHYRYTARRPSDKELLLLGCFALNMLLPVVYGRLSGIHQPGGSCSTLRGRFRFTILNQLCLWHLGDPDLYRSAAIALLRWEQTHSFIFSFRTRGKAYSSFPFWYS